MVDFFCVGVARRRWAGWKLAELAAHFAANPEERAKHKAWRLADIAFISQNGFHCAVTAHVTDQGIDATKKCVKTKHNMRETFHMGQGPFLAGTCL